MGIEEAAAAEPMWTEVMGAWVGLASAIATTVLAAAALIFTITTAVRAERAARFTQRTEWARKFGDFARASGDEARESFLSAERQALELSTAMLHKRDRIGAGQLQEGLTKMLLSAHSNPEADVKRRAASVGSDLVASSAVSWAANPRRFTVAADGWIRSISELVGPVKTKE